MSERILFICLTSKGLGETRHAVELAGQMRSSGAITHFLAHETASGILQDAAQPATFVPDHVLPLVRFFLDAVVKSFRPDAIVLGDWFTTSLALERSAQNYDDVFPSYDVPVYAIDTWCSELSGLNVDLYGNLKRPFPDWRPHFAGRLSPVPMGWTGQVATPFSAIPPALHLPRKLVRHIRRDLNAEDHKLVLFCSAGWQHADYENPDARRLRDYLPRLIGHHLRTLGEDVVLLHVGPQRLDFGLRENQLWLPSMRPERFDALVASVDLVLSANVSASTNARAIIEGVPVLVLGNSRHVATPAELPAEWIAGTGPEMLNLLEAALPVFPFHLWPLGYRAFIDPVLARSPYADALAFAEMLDIVGSRNRINSLLFDERARSDAQAALAAYADKVAVIPVVSDLASVSAQASDGRALQVAP